MPSPAAPAHPVDEARTASAPRARGGTSLGQRIRQGTAAAVGELTPEQRRSLWLILLVAAVARLAWAIYAAGEPPVGALEAGDQYSYYFYGRSIARGDGYTSYLSGEPTAYYPIGYPAGLAALFWVLEHTPIPNDYNLVTSLIQAALSVISVALVFVVGRRLFGVTAGLVAAGIVALFPNLVYQVATFQVETVFLFLLLSAVAVLVTVDWSTGPPTRRRLLTFGVLLGLSALVRPFSLGFLAALVVAVLATGLGWRTAARVAGWSLLPVLLLFTPWTIRNAVVMDAFIPSSTNMGDTLCIDRHDDSTGTFQWSEHDGCVAPDLPEPRRNTGNTRKAVAWVIDNPDRELVQIVRRARYIFRDDNDGVQAVESMGQGRFIPDDLRTVLKESADWFYYPVLALSVLGLPAFFSARRRPTGLFVGLGALSLVVVALLLWGNPRFHLPMLPFMAIAAAVPISALASRRGLRVPPSSPEPRTPHHAERVVARSGA